MSGMDCGGVYLFDDESGDLNLIVHQGLSEEFIQAVSHYNKNSDNSRHVKKGKPIYTVHKNFDVPMTPEEKREGIRAFMSVPASLIQITISPTFSHIICLANGTQYLFR